MERPSKDAPETMRSKITRFENMFSSERLTYVAIENTEEVVGFFSKLNADPTIRGLGEFGALKPMSKKNTSQFVDKIIDKAVLSVLIQIRPASSPDTSRPTTIGFLALVPGKWERTAGFALSIARDFQDKGFGKEALNWAMDWAFLWGGYHRVEIGAIDFNERALKLYADLGFEQEGRTRQVAWSDGEWHDLIEYGMMDHEWRALRAAV